MQKRIKEQLACLVIFLNSLQVRGVYFQLLNQIEKCFIEDLPIHTTIIGNYEVLEPSMDRHDGIQLEVYNPQGDVIY